MRVSPWRRTTDSGRDGNGRNPWDKDYAVQVDSVFERLLSRFSRIEGDASSLRWRPSLTLRGLESLEVVVS